MAQNTITLSLLQLDANGLTEARRPWTITDSAPTVGEWLSGSLPDNTNETITLPIAQPRQLMLRNVHASATITVTWTPNGGASATVLVLGPGDVIAFWHSLTGASYGISALKLQSSVNTGTPFELFIGG